MSPSRDDFPPISAVHNPKVAESDPTATDKIPVVTNPTQKSAWNALPIPTTEGPVLNNQAYFDTSTVAITPPALENQQQAQALASNTLPTNELPDDISVFRLSRHKLQGLRLLVIVIPITLLFFVIITTSLFLVLPVAKLRSPANSLPQATVIVHHTAPTNPTLQDAQQVTALGQQYMSALLNRHYDIMWSLLHPQLQAMWPDEASFGNFWQRRFQGFTLQSFRLGPAHSLTFWVNPETMQRYDQVEVLPISLDLTAQVPAAKMVLLPTLDQQPSAIFQNLSLIAVRTTLATDHKMLGQWRILHGGPADLEAPILPPLTPVSTKIDLPILMYHHITDAPTHNILDLSLTVTPEIFSQQLDYLKQHYYHTITFNQLFDFLYYHGPLPSKPIILSFDDGYEDAYTFAYPILKAHSYSGMFYIITGKVGWKGQATWDQLREMLANGMQMGSHTITHRDIGEVWRYSHSMAQQELQQSQHVMQAQLGRPIQQFCYPAGEPFHHQKREVQQAIMTLLEQDGYIGATTDPPPVGLTQDSQKPFILLRVRVDGRETLHSFFKSI